ncbi:MAG: DNA/RNA nuclease SfsA [Legionellales bacterium]|nr:DNA/RNA nuclease SfsA [Legionellales bacterium]
MQFPNKLIQGRLIKRYKRFLVDVELGDEGIETAYCPNTGSMLGCDIPGSSVWLSKSTNPSRKYIYTLEIVKVNSHYIGVNTAKPNYLVEEAIQGGQIKSLLGYKALSREVKYGQENSRIDILLEYENINCYVEVKNVTLVEDNIAFFPDAITTRGQKHLRELSNMVDLGERAVIFFCVQHTAANCFKPADHIDKKYGQLLRQAVNNGVEILAYKTNISPSKILINEEIPILLE